MAMWNVERKQAQDQDLGDVGASRTPGLDAGKTTLTGGLSAPRLLAKRDGNGVSDGAEELVTQASASSVGAELPTGIMRKFEASLGADLSGVRVHTGGESGESAAAVGAKAYTVGQDIHFAEGHYDPVSSAGEELLAHEVAHTVQQAGGAGQEAQFKMEVSAPGDAQEVEADRAALAMVNGESADVGGAATATARRVMRAEGVATPISGDPITSGGPAPIKDANVSQNEKAVDAAKAKQFAGWAAAVDGIRQKVIASTKSAKFGAMRGSLSGSGGALAAFKKISASYHSAEKTLLLQKKESEKKSKEADEACNAFMMLALSAATGLALGPAGLGLAHMMKLTPVLEVAFDTMVDAALDTAIELTAAKEGIKLDPDSAALLQEIKDMQQIIDLMSGVGHLEDLALNLSSAALSVLPELKDQLKAHSLTDTKALDKNLQPPSKVEAAFHAVEQIPAQCASLQGGSAALEGAVTKLNATAQARAAVTTPESALSELRAKMGEKAKLDEYEKYREEEASKHDGVTPVDIDERPADSYPAQIGKHGRVAERLGPNGRVAIDGASAKMGHKDDPDAAYHFTKPRELKSSFAASLYGGQDGNNIPAGTDVEVIAAVPAGGAGPWPGLNRLVVMVVDAGNKESADQVSCDLPAETDQGQCSDSPDVMGLYEKKPQPHIWDKKPAPLK